MARQYKKISVDPEFAKLLKKRAIDEDLTMVEFTRKFKKKKNDNFW